MRHKRTAIAGIGVTALVASAAIGGAMASTAAAATTTVNPFDVNRGFTIVAQGDATLGNAELEGSIAAFGSLDAEAGASFPLIHNAAGRADYTVPAIDGDPVRLLAATYEGSGAIELSNRDDSGSIDPTSPEATAGAKLVDTTELTGSARGANFLRLTNPEGGVLDLTAVDHRNEWRTDVETAEPSVAAYFGDLDAQVTQANQCFAEMYDPSLELSNAVTVEEEGGLVFVSGFSTTMPNVVDYDDVAGKTVKLDRADGYAPTADAPLVIRVPAGTTAIGQLNVEGWSPGAGAQQDYARYIMLDLSQVTGEVTIDGLAMGSIWAPEADLTFASGITTNGQWLAQDVTTDGGGEVHHHAFHGNLLCDLEAEPTPTDDPEPTPTEDPEPTPTEDPEPTPTEDPQPTPTERPEPTPTDDPQPAPTEDPEPTESPEPAPTADPEPAPTEDPEPTESPEPAPTDDPEPAPSEDPEPTPTEDPEPAPTEDPEPTESPEPTPTDDPQPAPTESPEPAPTEDPDPSHEPEPSPTSAPDEPGTNGPGTPDDDNIAPTGGDVAWPAAAVGAVLLVGGGALLIMRRRSRA